jgi:predicted ArsR family transcriptional regulator
MTNNDHKPDEGADRVLHNIQAIKDGRLNPKSLSDLERQECVELLSSEGYTQAQIGEVLKITDRTVRRDLVAIEERNALSPDLGLAKRIIGSMFQKAVAHHRYLVRLARTQGASVSDKSQSEFLAWRVLKEMVEKMQSLGYLPMRPQEIAGDLFHHLDDDAQEKSFEEARKTLDEVVRVASQCGNLTPELEKDVNLLQKKIEKAEITYESNELFKKQNNQNKETKNV